MTETASLYYYIIDARPVNNPEATIPSAQMPNSPPKTRELPRHATEGPSRITSAFPAACARTPTTLPHPHPHLRSYLPRADNPLGRPFQSPTVMKETNINGVI